MSAPVDVLAMLELARAVAESAGLKGDALDYKKAHTAVAELVAAGNEWCALMPGLAGGPEFDRLVSALARFGAQS